MDFSPYPLKHEPDNVPAFALVLVVVICLLTMGALIYRHETQTAAESQECFSRGLKYLPAEQMCARLEKP